MENKINIAELLKDCPKGMELDCTMWYNCTFDGIEDVGYINILVKTPTGQIKLSKEGCFVHNCNSAKCVIFPKGKTTWEGFQRPFKDGDIITCTNSSCSFVSIFKQQLTSDAFRRYTCLILEDNGRFSPKKELSDFVNPRLATKEEKQKLFQAIKDNGYKWNAETKTLEKLIEPKFKVGDRIKHIVGREEIATVVGVEKLHYNLDSKVGTSSFSISLQHEWELVPNKFDITALKPFDKVLVRNKSNEVWTANFYSHYDATSDKPFICVGWSEMNEYRYCIPYEVNNELLGTTNNTEEYGSR